MKSYKFRINGNEYNVDINSVEGNIADVTVNGASYQVEMENAPAPVQNRHRRQRQRSLRQAQRPPRHQPLRQPLRQEPANL